MRPSRRYIARILAFSQDQDPWAVLKSTADRLRALVAASPPEHWHQRPAPDKWSAAAVLAHLADAEIVSGWRVRSILAQDGVPLQPFDQDVGRRLGYERVDVHEALATFSATRGSLLSLLART